MKNFIVFLLAIAFAPILAMGQGVEGVTHAGSVTSTEYPVASNAVAIYTANTTTLRLRIAQVAGTETTTVTSVNSPASGNGFSTLIGITNIEFDALGLVPLAPLYAHTAGALNITNTLRVTVFNSTGAGTYLEGFTHPTSISETNISVVTNAPVLLLPANPNRLGFKIIDTSGLTNTTIGFEGTITSGHGYASITKSGSLTIQSPNVVPLTAIYGILDGITNGASILSTNTFHVVDYSK